MNHFNISDDINLSLIHRSRRQKMLKLSTLVPSPLVLSTFVAGNEFGVIAISITVRSLQHLCSQRQYPCTEAVSAEYKYHMVQVHPTSSYIIAFHSRTPSRRLPVGHCTNWCPWRRQYSMCRSTDSQALSGICHLARHCSLPVIHKGAALRRLVCSIQRWRQTRILEYNRQLFLVRLYS